MATTTDAARPPTSRRRGWLKEAAGARSPFVGRETELSSLLAAVAAPPEIVVVQGEAGVGKSRIAAELLHHPDVASRHRLLGACHPGAKDFDLAPLIDAMVDIYEDRAVPPLPPITGVLHAVLPELAACLPPPPPGRSGGPKRHEQFRALRELLTALGPAVCVLEDLHWADEGTIDFLSFLGAHLPPELTMILTYRKEDVAPGSALLGLPAAARAHATAIVLAPFSVAEVKAFAGSMLGAVEVSDEFAAFLHERTAGVPFAIEEVISLLREREDLRLLEPGRWARRTLPDLDVPPVLADAVQQRVQRLSESGQAVARAVAVHGRPVNEALIGRTAQLSSERTRRGLVEALSAALLLEERHGIYDLRHGLARQAVYDFIPGPERRHLHLRAAQALEGASGPREAVEIVEHLKRAGKTKKWLSGALEAADMAIATGNYRVATRLLADALVASDSSPSRQALIASKLAAAALISSQYDVALPLLRDILASERLRGKARGEVRLWLAELMIMTGEATAAREELKRASSDLRRYPGLASRALLDLAMPLTIDGDVDEHLGWLKRGVRTASRDSKPETHDSARATSTLVMLLLGDPEAWEMVSAEWYGGLPPITQAAFSLHLAGACLLVGHCDRAESLINQVRDTSAIGDQPLIMRTAEILRILIDHTRGRWEELDARVAAIADDVELDSLEQLTLGLVVGDLALARGEYDRAAEIYRMELERAFLRGSMPMLARAAAGRSRTARLIGRSDRACTVADVAISALRRKGVWVWGGDLVEAAVEAALTQGDLGTAEALAKEFAAGAAGRDAPAAAGSVLRCLGLVEEAGGDLEAAAGRFAEAAITWEEMGIAVSGARARADLGRVLLPASHAVAVDALYVALRRFETLGAVGEADRVRAQLRNAGVGTGRRPGRRSYGDELSPREQEVERLIGAGFTNKEVATALCISVRTVEEHVSRVLKKRRLTSRVALIMGQQQTTDPKKPVVARVDDRPA